MKTKNMYIVAELHKETQTSRSWRYSSFVTLNDHLGKEYDFRIIKTNGTRIKNIQIENDEYTVEICSV